MSTFTDLHIRGWIKTGERFDMRGFGGGLYLCYRENYALPVWRFRYRLKGSNKQCVMVLGSYRDMSLKVATQKAKELSIQVKQGFDPALEKQERIKESVVIREAKALEWTVDRLAKEYYERMILRQYKHPERVQALLTREICTHLGKRLVKDVEPMEIDAMLQAILDRGAPTTANDALRLTKKLFNYAIKRKITTGNPASAFTNREDAGGKETARDRALSLSELARLFEAMRSTKGFSIQNHHTFKLLLMLTVRKAELTEAKVNEFDLDNQVWRLPATRTKTGIAIEIPLPDSAVTALRELIRLGCSSPYLLPARKAQDRMLPHINENTLNVALGKVRQSLPDLEPFTIHDFRRTARTQLAALGIAPHVAERCLNHKLKGVEATYNHHDYFPERRAALNLWAQVVDACEEGREWLPEGDNVVPIRQKPSR